MPIAHAKQFLLRAMREPRLVSHINEAPDQTAVQNILNQEGLRFNVAEFEEAYRNLSTQCQTQDQTNLLDEVHMWWELLGQFFHEETQPTA